MRYLVSFKSNDREKELEKWILEKAHIIGFSSFMKQLAYEEMQREEKQGQGKDNNSLDFNFNGGF